MILPEGYELEFVVPSGSPEVFKNLIEYIDKEISLVICGENEAGQAEAGSRASSQVANTVRVVRASELSESISHTLTQTLIRWIVDLNFGTDVASPSLTREFRIEESSISVPDLSLLIQSGYTPRKEWIERHFRVELEEKGPEGAAAEEDNTTFDANKDQDIFGDIFGGGGTDPNAPGAQTGQAAAEGELAKAGAEMDMPAGATPEESQADAIGEPSLEDQVAAITGASGPPAGATPEESQSDTEMSDEEIADLLNMGGEQQPKKPFGNENITEDEAVEMDKK
jgi:hypothetical protein